MQQLGNVQVGQGPGSAPVVAAVKGKWGPPCLCQVSATRVAPLSALVGWGPAAGFCHRLPPGAAERTCRPGTCL